MEFSEDIAVMRGGGGEVLVDEASQEAGGGVGGSVSR